MIKHFRKKKPLPTELTWEEKNPIDYIYRPTEAIQRLQKMAESEKESNSSDKPTKNQEEHRVK